MSDREHLRPPASSPPIEKRRGRPPLKPFSDGWVTRFYRERQIQKRVGRPPLVKLPGGDIPAAFIMLYADVIEDDHREGTQPITQREAIRKALKKHGVRVPTDAQVNKLLRLRRRYKREQMA